VEDFQGYHSEWNLGSPGGWDYQRLTQTIGKTVWQKLNKIHNFDLDLDFDDPLFSPVDGLADVQEKIPLSLWAEEFPVVENGEIRLKANQTDFRCLMGPKGLLGFVGRFGGVPTNVGSGGGFQPLAVLRSDVSVRDAVNRINDTIMSMDTGDLLQVVAERDKMALDCEFTHSLGPVRIALRPRLITSAQIAALRRYGQKLWDDCLTLEKMWLAGELDQFVNIEEEELEIARLNPWGGSAAIIASDGLFDFGAANHD
jgi:hypothetical protein